MTAKEKKQAKNLTPERIESEGEHLEIILPNGSGRITAFHPFKSLQILCYELRSPEIPDLWELGFRRGGNSRYFRTLVCRKGRCEFSVNGTTKPLRFGQAEAMLRSTDLSVCKITELTGYSKQTKFTIAFKNYFGTTPLKYRGLTRAQ